MNVKEGDLKAEYLFPTIVDQCIRSGKERVRLLETQDKWFGVTYKEDKPMGVAVIQKQIQDGVIRRGYFNHI